MKKILSTFVVLLCVLQLTGCNKKEDGSTHVSDVVETLTPKKEVLLADFLQFEEKGRDHGSGELTFNVDWEGLNETVGADLILKVAKELKPSAVEAVMNDNGKFELNNLISLSATVPPVELSNGDSISVAAFPSMEYYDIDIEDIEEKLDISFVPAEHVMTSLPDSVVINFFDVIDEAIRFEGTEGEMTVKLDSDLINGKTIYEDENIYIKCVADDYGAMAAVYKTNSTGVYDDEVDLITALTYFGFTKDPQPYVNGDSYLMQLIKHIDTLKELGYVPLQVEKNYIITGLKEKGE